MVVKFTYMDLRKIQIFLAFLLEVEAVQVGKWGKILGEYSIQLIICPTDELQKARPGGSILCLFVVTL